MEDDVSSEGSQNPLLGFLFGNVDEGNKVDADYLDEVCGHCWFAAANEELDSKSPFLARSWQLHAEL